MTQEIGSRTQITATVPCRDPPTLHSTGNQALDRRIASRPRPQTGNRRRVGLWRCASGAKGIEDNGPRRGRRSFHCFFHSLPVIRPINPPQKRRHPGRRLKPCAAPSQPGSFQEPLAHHPPCPPAEDSSAPRSSIRSGAAGKRKAEKATGPLDCNSRRPSALCKDHAAFRHRR
jgi:hypothetical protein